MASDREIWKDYEAAVRELAATKGSHKKKLARNKCYKLKPFYSVRSIFGYQNCAFYILLGGRDYGKSYSIMDYFLRDFKRRGVPFYWLRLTDDAAQGLLQNNAAKFVDADLVRKYDLDLKVEGWEVFDHGVKMAEIQGLSTFYSKKGTASFDCEWKEGYNIMIDECVREVGEKNTFDINYSLVNQLENYVRDTKEKVRIVFACNYTQNCPDLLNLFNFVPTKFGRYHLFTHEPNLQAVLDYLPDTPKYVERRKDTVASRLMPSASTFTNKVELDFSNINKSHRQRPDLKLVFSNDTFILWHCQDGSNVFYCEDPKHPINLPTKTYAMEPFIGTMTFDPFWQKNYQNAWDRGMIQFDTLLTQQRFKMALQNAKKRR